MNINFKLNESNNKTLKVLCSSCSNITKHIVLTSISENGFEEWTEYHVFHWKTDYEIIQCLGCESVSFRSYSVNSEHDDYEGRQIPTVRLYPQRSNDTLSLKSFMNVPFNLQRIYSETIETYNYENLTLCGAGIRALVEGLCIENGISGGDVATLKHDGSTEIKRRTNLQGKINGLYESGKLTSEYAEILHEHRFLGNEAIHELATPSKEDLKLAIEIVENVFETLYEIPNKGLKLKRKRLNQ